MESFFLLAGNVHVAAAWCGSEARACMTEEMGLFLSFTTGSFGRVTRADNWLTED